MSTPPVRLTSLSHGGGCACKLSPAELGEVLGMVRSVAGPGDPDLLVGYDTSDDAAVYRLRDDLCLVVTTDFFTPIVDDPYDWGRVAAANALSDVYAMGGRPLLCLNLVAWPREGLDLALLARVLDGGADVARDAGALVVGGHSIDDAEPKYGMAVVGTAHPSELTTNAGARPGDVLVLTKPLGLGVVASALQRDLATPELVTTAVAVMTTLNAGAADAARSVGVRAATDVTGFGLAGHAREVARASQVRIELDAASLPVLVGVRELVAAGVVPGGTRRNHAFVSDAAHGPPTDWGDLSLDEQLVVADAQTSGGLLLAVPGERVEALVAACRERSTPAAAVVGRVVGGPVGVAVR